MNSLVRDVAPDKGDAPERSQIPPDQVQKFEVDDSARALATLKITPTG